MPKGSPSQGNFNAGEFSPYLYGQTTLPRYKNGLATCLNYIPALQGPLVRRPGTKYIGAVKDSARPPILVPFKFSETQAYMLEFGDGYIRFWANGGQVVASGTLYTCGANSNFNDAFILYGIQADQNPPLYWNFTGSNGGTAAVTPGVPLELQSPYNWADLPLLRWTQSADTLYIFHPSYKPMKLQRHGQLLWSIQSLYFRDGPYLPLNSYRTLGDSVRYTLAGSGTSGAISLTSGPTATVTAVASASGLIKVTTSAAHGYSVGDKVVVKGVTGTVSTAVNNAFGGGANGGYWIIAAVPTSTTFTLVGSTFSGSYTSGGTVYPAIFLLDGRTSANTTRDQGRAFALIESGARYWGTLTTVSDAATAGAVVELVYGVALPGTTAATAWMLGVWNPVDGYPACGCFHQSRLVIAGASSAPQEVDASAIDDFENFAISDRATLAVASDNAIQANLVASDVNAIHWVKSTAQGLLAGTFAGEWNMAPSSQNDALTPTNFNAIQTSQFGAAKVDSVQMGNAVLYVQRALRKVREMNFFFQVGTFRSTDLTEIAEHITIPTVTQLAVQKETLPLTWAVRSDGILASLSYDRDDQSLRSGWARHQLGGQSDAAGTAPIVKSIGVIPSTDLSFDQLWMVVQRWVNGATVATIEAMAKVFDDATLQEDSYHFDCGATYDSPVTITAISTANPAVVTANGHGFSNGDQVRIVSVIGLNESSTDADGNVTITNLVNEKTFVVASAATNTFALHDFNGNAVSSSAFSAYVSGGQVRKMVLTVTGLTFLENETVSVLADGAIHKDVVVSNSGVITLDFRAAKVQIGYKYNSDGQLLRPDAGAADGSSIGKTRRVSKVAVMLHRIGDFMMGMSFDRLLPVAFQQADQQEADQATPLFSGIHRDSVESDYDFDSQFCFRQNTGLPGCIQNVTLIMDEFDI